MIQKISTDFSSNTHKRILKALIENNNWGFGYDHELNLNPENFDAGFTLSSLQSHDSPLKIYAYFLFDIIQKHTPIKIKNITRINWNWYNKNSITDFHRDSREDNYYSILYNLHNNDGGTEFNVNNNIEFYPSIEGEALFFPSKILHRGIAPKKTANRFSLNIMGSLQ
jgi:hypothetical protein